jgi:hypothetical protein
MKTTETPTPIPINDQHLDIAPIVPNCDLGAGIRHVYPDTDAHLLACSGTGNDRVIIYQIGYDRVAETNGDPVWEESDPCGFADLLEVARIDPAEYNAVGPDVVQA